MALNWGERNITSLFNDFHLYDQPFLAYGTPLFSFQHTREALAEHVSREGKDGREHFHFFFSLVPFRLVPMSDSR